MISSTLNRSGPQIADTEHSVTPFSPTPTWYHAIIAAQDGDLERTKDGKYYGHVRGHWVELSEAETQPILQFIHEALPRDQDVQKEIDAHVAMLEELTQYVGAFVEGMQFRSACRPLLTILALREANILRSVLLENRDLLLSFLQRSLDFAHDTPNEPTSASSQIPSNQTPRNRSHIQTGLIPSKTDSSASKITEVRASEELRQQANHATRLSDHKSGSTSRISAGAMTGRARGIHDGVRMNVRRRSSSVNIQESLRQSMSPTPVSKAGDCNGLSQKEKLHRVAFLKSIIEKAVPWDDVPALYNEEFGIWRSAATLKTVYSQYKDRSKKLTETCAPSQPPPQTPTAGADNYGTRLSRQHRSPTPVSTQSKRIGASEQEIRYRYSFMHSQLENGATWDQMPALYKEEFGVWRTSASLRTVYCQYRAWNKNSTDRCVPSQPLPQTPTGGAGNHGVRRSERNRSPIPTSTRLKRINTTEQEKLHRSDFLLSQRREGLDWNEICSGYKKKFGIWRSAKALMGYHKIAVDSQKDTSSPRSISVHDDTNARSKKRKRSPSPAPATYTDIPPSEDEVLHRWSFLKSHREAGLSWNEVARLYHEDFGIFRPCKSLINCYNYNKQRDQMGSSVQESPSAKTPGSGRQDDRRVVRRRSSNHVAIYNGTEGNSIESTVSKARSLRRRSVSIESSTESSLSS